MEYFTSYGGYGGTSSAGLSRAQRPSASASTSTSAKDKPKSAKREREPSPDARDDDDDPPPTQELEELYVCLRTEIVGVQYYSGLVGADEHVMLRREPGNKYDSNAIQVLNASGTQVGHIPRLVAAQLAPLMDAGVITVEGRMITGNMDRRKHYKLAIDLPIYARGSYRHALEPMLEWATPERRGFEYMRKHGLNIYGDHRLAKIGLVVATSTKVDAGMKKILDGLTRVNGDEKAADGVMAALTADLDVTKLPLHESPPSLATGDLMTDLLPHQSQALRWMIQHENPVLPKTERDAAVQFWARQKDRSGGSYWLNVATKTPQDATPVLGRGGIIADGMGLGKTLTTLALVLATKAEKVAQGYTDTTLIVCPLSVLSNWEKQIQDHVVPGKLSCYTYHGTGKGVTAKTLAQYDIVLTTYQTIAGDAATSADTGSSKGKKPKTTSTTKAGPLAKVKWKRVVADEGHVMKNPKAKMTKAFASLDAERRWVVTGTPIVNAPNDLGSLLTCIKVCAPLDQHQYFRSLVLRPLKAGSPEGGRLLQAIVGQTLLRRTKDTKDKEGNKLVALPPIEYYQCPVKLDPKTRDIYDVVMKESVRRFKESIDSGESDITILSMITRMRQLCLSADLIPENYLEDIKSTPSKGGPSVSVSSLSPEDRQRLIDKLRQAVADQEECCICIDILDDARITDCGHAFCFACIAEVIRRQGLCPMDRHPLAEKSLLELPPDDAAEAEETAVAPPVRSAKITELLRYLTAFDKEDKTLVFSQFTTFLDRVAAVLEEEGIRFCRFDGRMNAKKRQEVIASFQTPVAVDPETPVVMLISLKSGAVGLNLTAASNVFLCDPWWQSAIEAQAVDRVHRMGQRKTVRVFQLIAEDTIESRVLDIQKAKDALVAKAFERSGTKESKQAKKQARFEELKQIFGV